VAAPGAAPHLPVGVARTDKEMEVVLEMGLFIIRVAVVVQVVQAEMR
jgi:hypothetical protein